MAAYHLTQVSHMDLVNLIHYIESKYSVIFPPKFFLKIYVCTPWYFYQHNYKPGLL